MPGQSWAQVKRLIESRRVRLNDELYLDPARRVHAGEVLEVLARPAPRPHEQEPVVIRHLDPHLVVVEKPAGINTVRHPAEREWTHKRKALMPTLEDLVPPLIHHRERAQRAMQKKAPLPRLRVVQRLDKETSGLVVFARTVEAERGLGLQFKEHTVMRRYLAVAPGVVNSQRIESRLVRDRGDGRRGSTKQEDAGKVAITHVELIERLPGYSLISCRLETGRTHQIRIHLAELGHPICGDEVYCHRKDGTCFLDQSGAPRLALHATELGFVHPVTDEEMHWTMDMPADLQEFLHRLRNREARP